jgi:heat shock protein 4
MEYLIDEEDLSYTMKREEFETIIEPVLTKLGHAIQKHKADLDALGLKLSTIELVGGGTRIPSFIRIIQNLFKVDPSRTINSNEAIAKGCAYMSAFKNPLFRPADFIIE